ncbi:NUDIX domain-containing protein [Streptomyces galbus]|uniref:NUDIX domain-containing protein n=1 Tax=Streptomyces galbus TaxID=33898 RepID=A0A4U5XA52_STRGB|nr:NUDIX domain-containing protein [Streptomyces galbus]TKT10436.1 NUDIX domain-containing protein [Streptomyces galbus]GHD22592.1 hypothetical protein GCM10010335_03960 [Streptomyces galbus]
MASGFRLTPVPGGGIDPGEQPVEALTRELLEETGLELVGARLLDARTSQRNGISWSLTALFYAASQPLRDIRDTAVLSPPAADAAHMLDRTWNRI